MESTQNHEAPRSNHQCLQVKKALRAAAEGQNGFSGNCGRVAVILNEVLAGNSEYVVVVGEHYEYADHVFMKWNDRLWDIGGPLTPEQAEARWCEDGEELEEFEGDEVVRMVDPNNVFAGGFDGEKLKHDLVKELMKVGFPVNPDLVPTAKAKGPKRPF